MFTIYFFTYLFKCILINGIISHWHIRQKQISVPLTRIDLRATKLLCAWEGYAL